MPSLKNAKHELFAQARAKGASVDDAYAQAGYKPHRGNAHRLSTNESVLSRVSELQSKVAEKTVWTAADRIVMLEEIARGCKDDEPRVAVSAIAEANKMAGSHAAQKLQHGGSIGTYDLTALSDDDIERLESILGPLAHAGGDTSGEGETTG